MCHIQSLVTESLRMGLIPPGFTMPSCSFRGGAHPGVVCGGGRRCHRCIKLVGSTLEFNAVFSLRDRLPGDLLHLDRKASGDSERCGLAVAPGRGRLRLKEREQLLIDDIGVGGA